MAQRPRNKQEYMGLCFPAFFDTNFTEVAAHQEHPFSSNKLQYREDMADQRSGIDIIPVGFQGPLGIKVANSLRVQKSKNDRIDFNVLYEFTWSGLIKQRVTRPGVEVPWYLLLIFTRLSMANPQKEDGYTPVANDIMEALAGIRISGEEWQCLCVILRKTYGWNKPTDSISLSQFVELTGIKKSNICRALNRLLSKKITTVIKKDNGCTEYALQKDYEKWEPLSKKITLSKKIMPVIKKDNGEIYDKSTENVDIINNSSRKKSKNSVIKKETHKNKYKTTSTKTKVKNWSPVVKFLVEEYFKTLSEDQQRRFEKQRGKFHKCCDMLLNHKDKSQRFTEEEIRKAINFARHEQFWSQNFLSFLKLRKTNSSGEMYIEVFLNQAAKKKDRKREFSTQQVDSIEESLEYLKQKREKNDKKI